MPLFTRHPSNPVLKPQDKNPWERLAVFNGTAIKRSDTTHLLYRAMGEETEVAGRKVRLSIIGRAESTDGVTFTNRTPFITPTEPWERFGCEDPRVTYIDGMYYIFYTALSSYPPGAPSIKSAVALSPDLITIKERHLVTPFNSKGMTLFPEKVNGKYAAMLTANTDLPPAVIALAAFDTLETLWNPYYWQEWYAHLPEHVIPLKRITSDQIEVGAPPLRTEHGWLLIYSYIKDYFGSKKTFRIEAAMLENDNPQNIRARVIDPCLVPEAPYEKQGVVADIVFPSGALIDKGLLSVYYGGADTCICLATAPLADVIAKMNQAAPEPVKCDKFVHNPLLVPVPEHPWEAKAVFNPAAVLIEDKTYIIYRTLSDRDVSAMGLAISYDGVHIDERLNELIYEPRAPFEKGEAGHSYGCEDPRITRIDDTLYLLYTAFDGQIPRLAISSLPVADFLARSWKKWSEPKIISPPGMTDKDGCLFPEKVDGKYVFFHRIEPNIVLDMTDDLTFSTKKYLDLTGIIFPRPKYWDGVKIGINSPPIKTDKGWLVFYHGISQIDHHYRLGALLLDPEDVTKVIARSPHPILEPEAPFELRGVVNNVVFPCGHVLRDGMIYIYYGGADTVVCGATIRLDDLLSYLLDTNTPRYLAP